MKEKYNKIIVISGRTVVEWIDKGTADKIKQILIDAELNEVIQIKSDKGLLKTSFDKATEFFLDERYYDKTGLVMCNRDLYLRSSNKILDIDSENYSTLFFGIGEWRNKGSYRLDDVHIVLGSKSQKLNGYFAQLDLSEAIEDDKYIYILKNITKNAGSGSCTRLYKGKGSLSNDKKKEMLLEILNPKTFIIDNHKWFVVSRIDKKDLGNKKNHSKIFSKFLKDFITYAFAIEEVRNVRE